MNVSACVVSASIVLYVYMERSLTETTFRKQTAS